MLKTHQPKGSSGSASHLMLALLLVGICVVAIIIAQSNQNGAKSGQPAQDHSQTSAASNHACPCKHSSAGPVSDQKSAADTNKVSEPAHQSQQARKSSLAANQQAARTGESPEQLSLMHRETPFDEIAYRSNPEPYLNRIVPSRIRETARSNSDAPELEPLGVPWATIAPGKTQTFQVKIPAGAPATWFSPHGGIVHSIDGERGGLDCLTTQADAEGIASVSWKASPDCTDLATLLVASPLAKGQFRFNIQVTTGPGQSPNRNVSSQQDSTP